MNPFYQALMQQIQNSPTYSSLGTPQLLSPSPQAYGQRIRRPDRQPGQGGTYHLPWDVPASAEPVAPPAQEEDPLVTLYKQIDSLWTQYHALGEELAWTAPEEVEEPELLDVPLSMPVLPMPQPAPLDNTAVILASLATLMNPAGGAQYLGVPLKMQEQATRTQQERWAALQQMVATQFRNVVDGIEAINRLRVQMYQLKKTKAEDLYRQRMTVLEQQRMRILDRISQMEQLAARLREERYYRQATAQARLTQAEAAMMRAQTGQEAVEARKPVWQAQADYLSARAESTRMLLPEQVRLMRAKVQQLSASSLRLLQQARDISTRVATKQNTILRTGRTYMSAEDVDVRNLNKTFYQLLALREKAVQEMLSQGYSMANAEDRAEVDSLIASHDDALARLAYQLYVSTGGRLNKFSLLRNGAVAADWQERAKAAVRQLEMGKAAASVPVLTLRPEGQAQPAQGATKQQQTQAKKSGVVSTVQRWWNAVRGWLAPKPQPAQGATKQQQPAKSSSGKVSVNKEKKQSLEVVVTDSTLKKAKQKKPVIRVKSFSEVQ